MRKGRFTVLEEDPTICPHTRLCPVTVKQIPSHMECWIPGNVEELIPFCLLDDKHPKAEHVRLLSIYSARGNTKIKTKSRYS
jgi:hypothetical protein